MENLTPIEAFALKYLDCPCDEHFDGFYDLYENSELDYKEGLFTLLRIKWLELEHPLDDFVTYAKVFTLASEGFEELETLPDFYSELVANAEDIFVGIFKHLEYI